MFSSWLFSYVIMATIARGDVSLRAELENTISSYLLKKEFISKDLTSLKGELAKIKEANKKSSVADRIYADMLIDSLDLVPDGKIKGPQCLKVKNQIRIQMEPTAQDVPAHPALKEAFKIVDRLCK